MGLIAGMILQNMRHKRLDEERARHDAQAGLLADKYFAPTQADEDGEVIARGGIFTRAGNQQERLAAGRQFVGDALRNDATRPAALSIFSSMLGENAQDERHSAQLQQQNAQWTRNYDRQVKESERSHILDQQRTAASIRASRAREHAALRSQQFTKDGGILIPSPGGAPARVGYLQGTDKWASAARTSQKTSSEINTMRSLRDDIRQNNWIMTPKLAGSLRIKLDRARSIWAGITNRGVLQKEEKAEIDKLIKDPTTFTRSPGAMAKLASALQTVEGMLKNDYDVNNAAYGHYPGMGEFFKLDAFEEMAPGETMAPGPGPNANYFQGPPVDAEPTGISTVPRGDPFSGPEFEAAMEDPDMGMSRPDRIRRELRERTNLRNRESLIAPEPERRTGGHAARLRNRRTAAGYPAGG